MMKNNWKVLAAILCSIMLPLSAMGMDHYLGGLTPQEFAGFYTNFAHKENNYQQVKSPQTTTLLPISVIVGNLKKEVDIMGNAHLLKVLEILPLHIVKKLSCYPEAPVAQTLVNVFTQIISYLVINSFCEYEYTNSFEYFRRIRLVQTLTEASLNDKSPFEQLAWDICFFLVSHEIESIIEK